MAYLQVGAAAFNAEEMGLAVERVERLATELPIFIDELCYETVPETDFLDLEF